MHTVLGTPGFGESVDRRGRVVRWLPARVSHRASSCGRAPIARSPMARSVSLDRRAPPFAAIAVLDLVLQGHEAARMDRAPDRARFEIELELDFIRPQRRTANRATGPAPRASPRLVR